MSRSNALNQIGDRMPNGTRFLGAHVSVGIGTCFWRSRYQAGLYGSAEPDRLARHIYPVRHEPRWQPIGVQLVSTWLAEVTLLHVASLLESASAVRDLQPSL
jgi:hypothetical protein